MTKQELEVMVEKLQKSIDEAVGVIQRVSQKVSAHDMVLTELRDVSEGLKQDVVALRGALEQK